MVLTNTPSCSLQSRRALAALQGLSHERTEAIKKKTQRWQLSEPGPSAQGTDAGREHRATGFGGVRREAMILGQTLISPTTS